MTANDPLSEGESTSPTGNPQGNGSALAIVLGSVLDGIPESMVIGLTTSRGERSALHPVAVFLSNLPESISATSGLVSGGWEKNRIL